VVLPAIGAFQRPSSQHLLHCWSPSGFHFCCRSAPSGCVQRTGCSACGLPTPGLVGSPHVHSSCLGPVSFAGFLLKYLRVHWHSLPPRRFAWPFSRRVGYSSRGVSLCRSFRFYVCRAFAVRRGYYSPFGPYLPVFFFVGTPLIFPWPLPVHEAHPGVIQYVILYKL
jgi:hypothetical protein